MRYKPTIDLRDLFNYTQLINGKLRLQVGQWVKLGSVKPSRFVCIQNGIIWAVHPSGALRPENCKVKQSRFIGLCADYKNIRS